ncbi:MAG: CheY-like chemotaxis protein [Alphaproteobacteria bacterium]|jgi:two-component system response regulator
MKPDNRRINILIADDDPDDRLLIEECLREARVSNDITFVEDGVELMDYLLKRGKYEGRSDDFMPGLILLDLNMPRKDGREALKEIRMDPELRRIPVIALTTSKEEEDISRTYDLGVSSYITKPVSFDEFVKTLSTVTEYWLRIVHIPRS